MLWLAGLVGIVFAMAVVFVYFYLRVGYLPLGFSL